MSTLEKMVKKTVLYSEDWYAVIKNDADKNVSDYMGGRVCFNNKFLKIKITN